MRRGLDRLLAAAGQQRLRQMKRIYLMQRHAEQQAALTRAQAEKEGKDRLRQRAMEAAAQRARAERQLQEALAEVCTPLRPLLQQHICSRPSLHGVDAGTAAPVHDTR